MIKNILVNTLKVRLLFALAFSIMIPATGQVIDHLAQVKSPYDEQHPVMSPTGDLYLTIAFHPENQSGAGDLGDVWLSTEGGAMEFQKPSRVKDLSTSGYDVVVGFLNDNSVLVYHDSKERMQGIHQYSGSGNSWTHEKQIQLGSFRNRSQHFSGRLSSSGDVLILSMDSFGSFGNEDIYVSFLQEEGHWSSPQNLGPQINTYHQEITPSLSVDKRLLFFSSNGHGSNGGRDIFYAERLDETWRKWDVPKALPIENTAGAELSYFQFHDDPTKAIFTSTQNSEGYGDILMVYDESPVQVEKKTTQEEVERLTSADTATQELLVAKSDKVPIQTTAEGPMDPKGTTKENAVIPDTQQTEGKVKGGPLRSKTESEGQIFQLKALDGNTLTEIDYEVSLFDSSGETYQKVSSEDFQHTSIDTASVKKITLTSAGYLPVTLTVGQVAGLSDPVLMTPASKGVSMVLDQVLFKRGTAELLDGNSMGIISSLADFLIDNPTIKILLEGHTDNLGNAQLNKELSLKRASAIRKYLVDKGVAFERMRIAGWGGTKPLASNKNEEGRIRNRRVEMEILDR